VLDEGCEIVRLVSDAPVVRHGHPLAARDIRQPDIVRAIRREVVGVSLYAKSCVPQDGGKLQAKIAIGEKYLLKPPARTGRVFDLGETEVVVGGNVGDRLSCIHAGNNGGRRDSSADDDGPPERNPRIDGDWHVRLGRLANDEWMQPNRKR
jgi:hypothetical protein